MIVLMPLDLKKDRSCWTCAFQLPLPDGRAGLGLCGWFANVKGEEPKPITSEIIDVGCKFHENKEAARGL